ncbi:hypothetical protein H4R33_000878 [Dimargaris cristalligena]|nr:hypothetical protein H4R33_000878 [Dimargaris cristalligena]
MVHLYVPALAVLALAHATPSLALDDGRPDFGCKEKTWTFTDANSLKDFITEGGDGDCAENIKVENNALVLSVNVACRYANIEFKNRVTQGFISVEAKVGDTPAGVSSIILGRKSEDEIDLEMVGDRPEQLETMYFKSYGRVFPDWDADRFKATPSLSTDFFQYGIDLNKKQVDWYLDNKVVRTLKKTLDRRFPMEADAVRMGVWDASHKGAWAGTMPTGGRAKMEIKSITYIPLCDTAAYARSRTAPAKLTTVEKLPRLRSMWSVGKTFLGETVLNWKASNSTIANVAGKMLGTIDKLVLGDNAGKAAPAYEAQKEAEKLEDMAANKPASPLPQQSEQPAPPTQTQQPEQMGALPKITQAPQNDVPKIPDTPQ